MLGKDLTAALSNQSVVALSKDDCDITSLNEVTKKIKNVDVVVNCAAYTAVDDAENYIDLANSVNGDGPRNLAIVCNQIGAKLVQISTDYVFAGNSKSAYQEDSETDPRSVYGKSKLIGELAVQEILPTNHYLVRTAWLYGKHGQNFGKTILKLAKTKDFIDVVDDQFGQPTWTIDLASKIIEIVSAQAKPGIYHGTASGETSWFDYAKSLFTLAGLDPDRIRPVDSSAFIRAASRPAYSVLGHQNLINNKIAPIRNWEVALKQAFKAGVFDV